MSYTSSKLMVPSILNLKHELQDSLATGGASLGFARANGTFDIPNVMGFKIGPLTRIENCTISIPNASYSGQFGVSSNWTLVKYFTTHDLNITSQGIGRSGTGNLGGGWDSDMCGFYLDIPQSTVSNADSIIIQYDYFTSNQKNGIGFWDSTSQPTGQDGSANFRIVGTWDNSVIFRLPTNLASTAYTNRGTFASGTRYRRRIVVRNT